MPSCVGTQYVGAEYGVRQLPFPGVPIKISRDIKFGISVDDIHINTNSINNKIT